MATSPTVPERLLSEAETAERLGLSPRGLIYQRNAGRVPFIKLGKRILYDWNAVVQKLKEGR